MNRYTLRFAAVLLAWLTFGPQVQAQAPEPGSCLTGRAEKDLDINNALARVFNTGSLFFGNSSEAAYLVPQSSGNSPVYASGIWIGGEVDGELRMAGATYADFEFWPGPLGDDGRPVNPSDCSEYDRIWKVSRGDILTYEGTGVASTDLASWPVELGAPVIAAAGNGIDDDGDGIVDEDSDGIDNNGDGRIDDIKEVEYSSTYNLAAGDRPDIVGDQALWWVMNDVGNAHRNLNTPPIGVEVQVLAWAFSRSDALGETTFYKYRVINKSNDTIENTYLSVFSDPDLGGASDDMVGSDPESGLGFVYNADNSDDAYGIPPAAGYDFFQGPIVDGDTLGTDSFMYFENCQGQPTCDPQDATGYYNFMQGLWGDGTPMTARGNGYQTEGDVTKFAFPGDPVNSDFWSELDTDGNDTPTGTGTDRRFLISSGPFDFAPGDVQDIVFGIVFGQGGDNLSSISVLRAADELAQTAYNICFELPSPPPAPPACSAASPDPQLQPGSGSCAEAIAQDEAVTLVWGYPSNSPNFLGAFTAVDQLVAIDPDADALYEFEGFNIYRYPTSGFAQDQAVRIATFDKVNGVTQVIDSDTDPITNQERFFVAAEGTDSGLQYTLTIEGLTNYTDYFYGITAYSFNEASIPMVLESAPTQLTARPSLVAAGNGGTILNAERGDFIQGTRIEGLGAADLTVRVVDPTQLVAATYTVEFVELPDDGDDETPQPRTFIVRRDGVVVFNGPAAFDEDGVVTGFESPNLIIDGLEFFSRDFDIAGDLDEQPDFSGDGDGILEIAYGGDEMTCPDPSDPDDPGCEFYEVGNSVFLTGNVNDDYYIGTDTDAGISRLARYVASLAPYDAEIRFTDGASWGLEFGAAPDGATVWSVPFELWNLGNTPDDASDDVRMIPFIIHEGDEPYVWGQTFPRTDPANPNNPLPATNRVYWMMPDRVNGYELFAEAAALAGAGNPYVDTDVTDTPIDEDNLFVGDIDPTTGDVCANTGGYVSFCYRNTETSEAAGASPAGGTFVYPIGRMTFVDLAQDGTVPPSGTVVRFITSKPLLAVGDVFTFDTSALVAQLGDATTAEESLDLIAAVPNPYLGTSAYESDNTDRVIRFTNIPDVATLRIFTVNGSLVRRINKDGPSRSIDWDLTTENNLPVASGMYFVHVEVPGVGDRVLKVGVINRQTDVTIF